MDTSSANSAAGQRVSWLIAIACCLLVAACVSGCGDPGPLPIEMTISHVASLGPHKPYWLPANTKLEALQKCEITFPGGDLFAPGEVIGEVVVIDDDALMELAPHNEKVTVRLKRGQSMVITKDRTITVVQTDASPARFQLTLSGEE